MAKWVASLGMYDGGELTAANDALWANMAERLRGAGLEDVPSTLERGVPLGQIWADAGLLFGQTCGYPLARHFRQTMTVVGAPSYDAPGCRGAFHRSFIVVRAESAITTLEHLRHVRPVINDVESNTGRQLFGDAVADLTLEAPFFRSVRVSGSHAESLRMVAEGEADAAAIDCVTHAHLERARPEWVARTRVLHATRETPSLPLVMASGLGLEITAIVARCLDEALHDPRTEPARRTLRLKEVTAMAASAYECTLAFRDRADRVFGPAADLDLV